jgi:hypothetical protein
MSLEKNAELICMSPFMKGDKTIVYVRLHSSVIQEALRNGIMLRVARAIKTSCKHGNLARSAPRRRIQPTPHMEFKGLIKL